MKKALTLISTILFIWQNCEAQKNNISGIIEINYNTFSHNRLRDFQQELSDDIDEVNLQTNDDFSSNVGYSIGIKVEDINTQFFVSYNSTGGKLSYSDYSGIIRLTQLLKGYTVGGEYQFKLSNDGSKEMFYFGTRASINYSELDLESYSKISDNVSRESIDFKSIDIGLGVRFIYDIPISIVKLRFNIGYDVMIGGDLKFKENNDFSLEDDGGDRVRTGWSGFRSGIGIVVPF